MYHRIDFSGILDRDLQDFVERALAKEYAQRLTPTEAINHKFLKKQF